MSASYFVLINLLHTVVVISFVSNSCRIFSNRPSPQLHVVYGSVLLRILLLLLLWTHTAMCSMNSSNGHISLPSLSTAANIPTSEWNALYDLYNATNGLNWRWSKNPTAGFAWNFTNPAVNNPCVDHWQGVICKYFPQNEYYHVTQIVLSSYRLAGKLLPSLSAFSDLVNLDLNTNSLTGPIPGSLCSLTQLAHFDLYNNMLTGPIPGSLGSLTQLVYMALDTNSLTGPIPGSLGSLTLLEYLDLDTNMLTGPIPESLGSLSQLLYLFLEINMLTGPIPESLGSIAHLQLLDLHDNKLAGPIPGSLGSLTQLVHLDLDTNKLTGPIPESLGSLTHLAHLNLYNNMLTGSIPGSSGSLTQLVYLALDINRLTGPIPESLGMLTQLRNIALNNNTLTGSIPEALGGLKELLYMYLNNNQFTGSIPESLGNLTQLLSLGLNANMLFGTIPNISLMSSLCTLELQNNCLTGNIEGLFNPTTQLEVELISLNSNQLTGTLPESIFHSGLQSFSAIDNCFEGPLPITAICNSSSLTNLILDGMSSAASCQNKLFGSTYTLKYVVGGTVPVCLFRLPYITTLHLSGNGFTGSIPNDIVISDTLSDLSLSHNALTGSIPHQIQQRMWGNIDLSFNRLSDVLLPSFATNGSISLDNNRLSGDIPASFFTLHKISVLGSNMFSCRYDESDLPKYDPDRERYHCGSNSFNSIFFTWLGAIFCAVVGFGCFKWTHVYDKVQDLQPGSCLLSSLSKACSLSLTSSFYSIVILLPVYSAFSILYGTQTYTYAYQVSAIFLSGVVPFAAILLLGCVMAASGNYAQIDVVQFVKGRASVAKHHCLDIFI